MRLERWVRSGTTNYSERVYVRTIASSLGKTALTNSDLSASYIRDGDVGETAISLVAGTVGSHTDGGFKLVDDTNMPGVYQLDVPDAVFADGANHATVLLYSINSDAEEPVLIDYFLTDKSPFAEPKNDHRIRGID